MSESTSTGAENWDEWFEPTMDYDALTGKFQEEDEEFLTIAILALIIGLFGLAANFQIFSFYWGRRKELVPSLYIALSITDFVCSLTAIIHFVALLLLVTDRKDADGFRLFLAIVFVITTLVLRISVFVNVQLIVVRTINIKRPFYQINRLALWVALAVVIMILLPIIIYDAVRINGDENFYETKVRFVFLPYVGDFCIRDIIFATMDLKAGKGQMITIPEYVTFFTSCAPFIIAVLISVVCLVMNYTLLRASNESFRKSDARKSTEREVTITITMLTVVFSVCNTVYSVWIILMWAFGWDYWQNQTVLQISYTTSTLFPFISSALNPTILILRSMALKNSVMCRIRAMCPCMSRDIQVNALSGTESTMVENAIAEKSL